MVRWLQLAGAHSCSSGWHRQALMAVSPFGFILVPVDSVLNLLGCISAATPAVSLQQLPLEQLEAWGFKARLLPCKAGLQAGAWGAPEEVVGLPLHGPLATHLPAPTCSAYLGSQEEAADLHISSGTDALPALRVHKGSQLLLLGRKVATSCTLCAGSLLNGTDVGAPRGHQCLRVFPS